MNEKITDRELENRYPDERELTGWFESLSDRNQQNFYFEFEALVPDWIIFLRRKRHEIYQANKKRSD